LEDPPDPAPERPAPSVGASRVVPSCAWGGADDRDAASDRSQPVTLRARLVLALLAVFSVGMVVYGVASYQAFARSELARLDAQVQASLPVAERELFGSIGGAPAGQRGGRGGAGPQVVVAPGTYAELRDVDDTTVGAVQVADDRIRPDLTGVDVEALARSGATTTVASAEGDERWRVAVSAPAPGWRVVIAVPMTAVEQALARLLAIEVVAGLALLLALAVGSWLVLRSGLRPLERMAAAAGTITAGSLDQRVPVPATDTEVRQLATALNGMLEDLEVAFHEREATEARLRRFLSDASHELRTPLTSIQGYAELFRLGRDDDRVDLELLARRIEAESGRMRQLVEDLLALARLDEVSQPVREPVDLAVLAADACSDAAVLDGDRHITLDAPQPVPVAGDPDHLRRAIGNLVTNALRHTPSGTPVTVRATIRDGRGAVEVRDRGPGLSEEALARAFDRFWRADPSRGGDGTGLGLAIVHAVATEHGGRATAANAPGGGARFTIEVPSAAAPPRGSDRASGQEGAVVH
jgi:two-component system, OmpR family, sensor kinase